MLASIVHTLDPFALEFAPGLGLRWYGLAYLSGFVVAYLLMRWMARTGRSLMRPEEVDGFLTSMVLGVLLGGRLGHVLFYEPSLLWSFSDAFPFWGLLEIHKGGMASHGGIAGVIIAAVWFGKRHWISGLHMLDMVAFATCPGLMFGRLANWVNGELWGRALPPVEQATPPWWSVKYPTEMYEITFDVSRAQPALEAARASGVSGVEGEPWTVMLVRACYEGNEQVIRALEPALTAYYPSNFFQALTDGPILMGVLALLWLKPRKPGVIGGSFLIAYGVLREVTEQYREPDPGVAMIGPLTLPMALSLLMIAAGAVMVTICARRAHDPVCGLLRR